MNPIRFFFALVLSVSVLLSSCSGKKKTTKTSDTPKTASTAATTKITANDNGKTFHVKVNEKFAASFNECVGCAQVWKVSDMDNDKLEMLPNTYSDRSCKNCNGGSQTNTFHFKARATGSSKLTFTYFEQLVAVTIIIE